MPVIDVHTHMLDKGWMSLLRAHGAPRQEVREGPNGQPVIYTDGAPFLAPSPEHFDYEARIKAMDAAGVDIAVISLTCPNVFWGDAEVSARAARTINESTAAAQALYPDRIRWMASLPWQYPDRAIAELHESLSRGAVGVMVLANIEGEQLTDERFAPIWKAIDDLGLPVLLHPTMPPGASEMNLGPQGLVAVVGFMLDTTLAVTRMIFDGFFERYSRLKLIVSHAGATLPYIAGRLDLCFDRMPSCREKTSIRPTEWLRRIYYDAVAYDPRALALCVEVGGADKVLYGSDYPHSIGDMSLSLRNVDAMGAASEAIRHRNATRIFKI